jgi:hypothetical protein
MSEADCIWGFVEIARMQAQRVFRETAIGAKLL